MKRGHLYPDLIFVEGGEVGIGVQSPQAKLDVGGGVRLAGPLLWSTDATLNNNIGDATMLGRPHSIFVGEEAWIGSSLNVGAGPPSPPSGLGQIAVRSTTGYWTRGFHAYEESADTVGPLVAGYKRRAATDPAGAVLTDDSLLDLEAWGRDDDDWGLGARVRAQAAENWTTAAHGSHLLFFTAPSGGTIEVERARLTAAGFVGVGVAAPLNMLHVSRDAFCAVIVDGYSADAATSPSTFQRRARGTRASPSGVLASDRIAQIQMAGYDGSAFAVGADILAFAAENWSGTARGSRWRFRIVPPTSTTLVSALDITEPADTETVLWLRRNLGGTLTLQRVSMGVPGSGAAGFRLLRVPNAGGDTDAYARLFQVFGGLHTGTLATAATDFLSITEQRTTLTTEPQKANVLLVATDVRAFRVDLATAPGQGTTRVFTIFKNNVATDATVTISGTATTATWTGTVAFAALDTISIAATITAGTPAASTAKWTLRVCETAA